MKAFSILRGRAEDDARSRARVAVGEQRLLRRATRRIALQTSGAIAAVVLAMTGAVLIVDAHQRNQQALDSARSTWASADDLTDPATDTWLVVRRITGVRAVTPGAPSVLTRLDPAALPDGPSRTVRAGRQFVVWTGDRQMGRVSAAYDLGAHAQEASRSRNSLGIAALVGVLGAAAVGAMIGRRAVQPLGAAMALQQRFVADASHELRTPLTLLLTRAQLLRRRGEGLLAPDGVEELDRLVHDARVLGEVINDLLLSAELQNAPGRGVRLDVGELSAGVSADLQVLAAQRGVELSSQVRIGGAGDEPYVKAVPAALRRALTSLVDNALAHTSPRGHVRLEVRVEGAWVLVAVVDDGEGLDPARAQDLVRRFSRGTVSDSERRFGLGLALVDEIARAHGGQLHIDGAPGRGASFVLRLPRVQASAAGD